MIHPLIVDAKAELNTDGFIGFSGTSVLVFLIDTLTDSDGSVMEAAKEFGVLTGEFGFNLDAPYNETYGVKLEALAGYYKYRVIDLPNTAYSMFMLGVEPYKKFNHLIFGGGYGRFFGSQWDEVLGLDVSAYRSHQGDAFWISTGYRLERMEFNIRYRYHRFTKIDEIELERYEGSDYERLRDDIIFVFRLTYRFDI